MEVPSLGLLYKAILLRFICIHKTDVLFRACQCRLDEGQLLGAWMAPRWLDDFEHKGTALAQHAHVSILPPTYEGPEGEDMPYCR